MENERAIVIDVPNTLVREIVYTYLGPKKPNGEALYDLGFSLHPELDRFDELPNGDHRIYFAKDKSTVTLSPKWIYYTDVIRPAKKTVMGKPESQKPTVIQ